MGNFDSLRRAASARGRTRILAGMEIEEVRPNEPSFLKVVLMAAAAILIIIVAAMSLVAWRAKKKNAVPYTKHPVSQIQRLPARSFAA